MNITTTVAAVAAGTTGRAAASIRYVLFQDKQTNGAQVVATEVMANAATSVTGMTADLDFMSLANLGRFNILWDKRFIMRDPNFASTGAADTYDSNGLKVSHKVRHKFIKPVPVNFKTATTEQNANVVDNSFHFIGVVDNNALAPQVKYVCRTSFYDN